MEPQTGQAETTFPADLYQSSTTSVLIVSFELSELILEVKMAATGTINPTMASRIQWPRLFMAIKYSLVIAHKPNMVIYEAGGRRGDAKRRKLRAGASSQQRSRAAEQKPVQAQMLGRGFFPLQMSPPQTAGCGNLHLWRASTPQAGRPTRLRLNWRHCWSQIGLARTLHFSHVASVLWSRKLSFNPTAACGRRWTLRSHFRMIFITQVLHQVVLWAL